MAKIRQGWATLLLGALGFGLFWAIPVQAAVDVLARVKANEVVRCGSDTVPGFSEVDDMGQPRGFEIDFCRAVAAAVFGDDGALVVERISSANKYKALVSGDADLVFGMSTWTYSRDTEFMTRFVAPLFFDGQGFLAWSGTPQAQGLIKGSSVCVQKNTTSIHNLRDYSARNNLGLKLVETHSSENRLLRFIRKECQLLTGDRSELSAQRVSATLDPKLWTLLNLTISRDPLGPYVIAEDTRWFALVRWVINVTQIAEERGINRLNIAEITTESDGELRRLAGLEPGFGAPLGLDDGWARRVIEQVGNYGEIFERNIGADSKFKFERGPNSLVRDGGWIFPPPLR